MSNLILCKKCDMLEKNGQQRHNVFYRDGEYCKQCRQEKIFNILRENPIKTLEQIRKDFGGKNGRKQTK